MMQQRTKNLFGIHHMLPSILKAPAPSVSLCQPTLLLQHGAGFAERKIIFHFFSYSSEFD